MDARLLEGERLLRLAQIIGQEEVTGEQASVNKAKADAIRKKYSQPHPDPKVWKQQQKQMARELAKVGPRRARQKIKPVIPVGRSTFLAGVASGRFPQPVRNGRVTFWRESEILALTQEQTHVDSHPLKGKLKYL